MDTLQLAQTFCVSTLSIDNMKVMSIDSDAPISIDYDVYISIDSQDRGGSTCQLSTLAKIVLKEQKLTSNTKPDTTACLGAWYTCDRILQTSLEGLLVGISSDIFDGTVLRNIPREKRYRNIAVGIFRGSVSVGIFRGIFRGDMPSEYSEEICLWNIPRKLSSEYPEGYTSSEYSPK
ncbi:hypothetical protein F2Q69_00022848 [Brassica cretica]|uniref:Uncharacterized protein n=1 Tax=Brassica cretica TaxID=69181 RepID=A0A8S9QJS5_BRACR|nr:hypothetical protein F2Q69_00022848 [Brassica cretica]